MNTQTQAALKMAINLLESLKTGKENPTQSNIHIVCSICEEALATNKESSLVQQAQVTRLEVIDNNGRSYVNMGVDKLEFSYQDDGKTLKLFTNGAGALQLPSGNNRQHNR